MKIFIICSKVFYYKIPEIRNTLEKNGHVITLPNTYNDPTTEARYKKMGNTEHSKWKAGMIRRSAKVMERNDAVLVLNFAKNGIKNYIGGATFLEMHDAFRLKKKIYLFNDIPDGILTDEINGFRPTVIAGDLSKII